MTAQVPALLEPYLSPSKDSLILLTSVLGASTNWLILRYMHSILAPQPGLDSTAEGATKVMLVSFLRDFAFWSDGAKKLGLDLSKLISQKRFMFVDGLSELFLPVPAASGTVKSEKEGFAMLHGAELGGVSGEILAAMKRLAGATGERVGERITLVIDGLDLLLAAGGKDSSPVGLGEMVLDLREQVHATIIALSDDSPLALRQQTPLEVNHATFLTSVAYQAHLVISLRLLDTGRARDVSGVIRVNVKDGCELDATLSKVEGREMLYFIGGDGNLKVFERG